MKAIYLAGPDVFLPEFDDLIGEKARLVREHGFLPIYAGVIAYPEFADKRKTGRAISAVNEFLMRGSDAIIANLTPFRGIAADTGTVFEVGFMAALGKPVFAYTNTPVDHHTRILRYYSQRAQCEGHPGGATIDGTMIEDFEMVDNLMIDGAIENRGGSIVKGTDEAGTLSGDLTAFRVCLKLLNEAAI
ncbi:nucleoside 2-deoxyribosyltransferase [Rhizobium rhizogenes]|uniref:nucleoside 2-deoxyribosyltransferase n=1 Tax=Rhizobium rhizogenes TaxID=359 RepID=UPI001F1DC46B|nr:nucleoside 2-deoxyribosyltransferase [Rhizobium rhizogenes]